MSGFVQRCAVSGGGAGLTLAVVNGLTVAVKDTIDIAGLPTKAGSRALDGAPPAAAHAAVVQAVLDAGCRIIGKTVLHEFAYGMTGLNDWAGTPLNPRFPALVPGGSSSGSAAVVAEGLVDFAIGTDTGGSIRLPAACCGIYGLKPTFGRVDRRGVMPEHTSLDCVGPMADSLDMLIAGMAALDPTFRPRTPGERFPRLGVLSVDVDPAIAGAVAAALQRTDLLLHPVRLDGLKAAFDAGLVVINAETWAACGAYLTSGLVGPDVAARLERARATTADDLAAAEAVRTQFTAEVDRALSDVDALVLPTLPSFPMTLADARTGKVDLGASALVRPFNLSGHPALTLPLPAVDGRPVGLQLVGRKGEDEALCAVAQRLLTLLGGPNQENKD